MISFHVVHGDLTHSWGPCPAALSAGENNPSQSGAPTTRSSLWSLVGFHNHRLFMAAVCQMLSLTAGPSHTHSLDQLPTPDHRRPPTQENN